MSRIRIQGSEFVDSDLEFSVCSHLQPILEFLETNGNSYDHSAPMYADKGNGPTRFIKGAINFDLLESTFEFPAFIKINPKEKVVFCNRCWCNIVEGRSPIDPL